MSEHEKRCHNNSEQPLQEQLPRRHFIDASSPPANMCCQTRCLDSRNHGEGHLTVLWIPALTNRLVFVGGIAWKQSLFGWSNIQEFGKPSWPEWAPFLLAPGREQSLLCLRSSPGCSAISEAQQALCLPVLPDYLPQCLLFIIISTQCSPPKVSHLRADSSWREYRGALIHTSSPFQECTVSYDSE